jgi:hypothetical protein
MNERGLFNEGETSAEVTSGRIMEQHYRVQFTSKDWESSRGLFHDTIPTSA